MNNDKQVMFLWAKKEERAGHFYWLPLLIHLNDTMNVSRWLWMNWLSDSQRQFCIKSISPADEETASNLAAFLGAIHDIGKATPAFQIQKGYNNSSDLDDTLLEKLERTGFSGISSLALTDPRKTHHSIAGEYLLKKEFQVKDDIGSIVGGHHGKPVDDPFSIDAQSAYPANYYQSEDSSSNIYSKWKNVHQTIFQWALEKSGFSNVGMLPEISLPAQVLYSGLLIMADWIASNSDYFPLIDIDTESVSDVAVRYRNGIISWDGNLPIQIQSYPGMENLFENRFGFEPRDFQKTAYRTVSQIKNPGIIILEAPMGLGKTETALAAVEMVSAKTGSSGLFFGLPTQATSNSMFGRVYEWLENVTSEYEKKQSLRLSHGKAALLSHGKAAMNKDENEFRSKSSPKGINIDDKDDGSVYVNEWFSGRKKAALDDFVVGTVDGFLLAALKQKHLALRHLGLSKKVVVIDEVHAYDTYMQQYLEEAIQWMGAYGTPVILASATLPKEMRKNLIAAYLKGRGKKKRDIQFPEALFGNSYPQISYTDGEEVKVQTEFSLMKDKTVHVNSLDEERLQELLEELIRDGGVVGIIVNTVKKAQKLGKECKEHFGESNVDILHSAFIATDRVKKETDLINKIGKQGKRPDRRIIIGTQVIEQSLDIDFDVLITELCPVDLLLQRIGRLQRHDIQRPAKLREPDVYVTGINDQLEFDKGSEYVYGKYFLIRTQYFLPKEIKIPSDISVLIDKVYGNEELELEKEQYNIYRESLEQMKVQQKNKSDKALTFRIQKPQRTIKSDKYNLISWLKDPDQSNSEETAAAQVRDIRETIEVVAVKGIDNGYGTFEKEEDISERISEPQIAKELAKQTIRLPNYVTLRKGIWETIQELEKYNQKYLPDWQKQPWLKGSLGIIFDEDGHYEINGIHLKYDKKYGLLEENEYGKV
ncbi:MAG: CRISPR-associated helicase Cas3' [Parasporobacterium sp.]|nr:CRISPR-associated helicase Cas3' [Parasporobacterium sp.]